MLQTTFLTSFALLCFAANSVLCRLALKSGAADAAGFTMVRLAAGALVLLALLQWRQRARRSPAPGRRRGVAGGWLAAAMLFAYAVGFSYAYVQLDTASGALILFGTVQLTIVLAGLLQGNRPGVLEWLGLAVASSGLVYLLLPGAAAPSLPGFLLMSAAGVAWGCYTLLGAGSQQPLQDTSANFLRCVPLAALLLVFAYRQVDLSWPGALLAIASGGVASGIGYAVWYRALPLLSKTQSAVVQLLVPVLAGAAGILLLHEPPSGRLPQAAALILGGILMVTAGRTRALKRD